MAVIPYKIQQLEKEYGDLNHVIPKLVGTGGQKYAAFQLNVSGATISRWLKDNGYTKKIIWVKVEKTA